MSACNLGMRVFKTIPRPTADEVGLLASATVSEISDVVRGIGVLCHGIQPIYQPMPRFAGPALTVDVSPGDGLLIRAAIEVSEPGDVLVVNGHGEASRAVLGGAVAMHIVKRGIRGLIVDGAVRDLAELRDLGLPVWARAVVPRSGTTGSGCGEVNVPIACGGAVVHPGDLIVSDQDGLIVVPRRWISDVATHIGASGHVRVVKSDIKGALAALSPTATVPGSATLKAALAERNGIVLACSYENSPGPG